MKKMIVALVVAGSLAFLSLGCEKKEEAPKAPTETMKETGEKMKKEAQQTGEKLKKDAEQTGETLKKDLGVK